MHIPLAKLATPFAEGEALRLSSVSHPEYIGRVAKFFSDIGGRALLMHGTEGEVYANPQRCPQINLIDREGMRVLYEKQDTAGSELLPQAKDPETTAQWIERCPGWQRTDSRIAENPDGLLPWWLRVKRQLSAMAWRALIRHFNFLSQPDEPRHPAFTPTAI